MGSKHTPGPWAIGPELNSVRPGSIPVIARVRDSLRGEMHVAFVNGMAGEQESNARLIAAAPELLAALIPLAAWAENERRRHAAAPDDSEANEAAYMGSLADTAHAAIAKVEGR